MSPLINKRFSQTGFWKIAVVILLGMVNDLDSAAWWTKYDKISGQP